MGEPAKKADAKSAPTRVVEAGSATASEGFCGNATSTTKYTLINFVPKQLFEQFRRLANVYFLLIICIQFVPGLSPLNPFASIFPLVLVLVITATKEAIEDSRRAKQDRATNARAARVVRDGALVTVSWKDVRVGDIVQLGHGELFPCDLVLLSTTGEHGLCYVETSSLDGETNLKIRQCREETQSRCGDMAAVSAFRGTVECEAPNNRLYTFKGSVTIGTERVPLDNRQVLLRGAQLRNTKSVFGLAVYTGHDTKLMRNATDPPSKQSRMDKLMNRAVVFIFAFQLSLCMFSGYWAAYSHGGIRHAEYLGSMIRESSAYVGLLSFFSFLILLNVMIPISLYVSAEVVRVIQAKLMEADVEMYYAAKDTPMKARTSNLNEELGQVSYVFSDKTGTLTQNYMEFLKCSVGGHTYGYALTEAAIGAALREGRHVTPSPLASKASEDGEFYFDDPRLLERLRGHHETAPSIDEFLTLLAVCHTVIAEPSDTVPSGLLYQAASPDEGALVQAARGLGYRFASRTAGEIVILADGSERTYELLNVLEFTSSRKRMSVIVKDKRDGRTLLLTKGADSIIYAMLHEGQDALKATTLAHLEEFAKEGLRTLVLAMAELDPAVYDPWAARYAEASVAIEAREERMAVLQDEIETGLKLIGATAIEDKLQDGVAETIQSLLQAGMRVWVLTGDKQETAVNIGYSCALLYEAMSLIALEGDSVDSLAGKIALAMDRYKDFTGDIGLVIDGRALEFALDPKLAPQFLALATKAKSVICCRVSPLQKALVVQLVRSSLPVVTLAIGDGANDVSMIQAAHVGIGISGNEGMQAVMASDYAIAQFRFLKRLLLVHGRWCYNRLAMLILYSFYKNMVFVIPQFIFCFFAAGSAQTMYHSNFIPLFNVFFTGLPIILIASLDQDVSASRSLEFPELYKGGQTNHAFNMRLFLLWIANAIVHALFIFFGVTLSIGITSQSNGQATDVFFMGTVIFTLVVLVVSGKVGLHTQYWTHLHWIALLVSLASWFITLAISAVATVLFPEMTWMAFRMMGTASVWALSLVVLVACLFLDLSIIYIRRRVRPRRVHIIQELQQSSVQKSLLSRMEERNLTSVINREQSHADNPLAYKDHTGFAFAQESGQNFAATLLPIRHVAHWRRLARTRTNARSALASGNSEEELSAGVSPRSSNNLAVPRLAATATLLASAPSSPKGRNSSTANSTSASTNASERRSMASRARSNAVGPMPPGKK
eukprot:c16560_g1_i2.p1 GENE.c16560_g1_i2~~c16560_g1_i2.p1  ORF type:complete len:1234 (+),score=220.28 c16560_g1_i2:146-3847(+)